MLRRVRYGALLARHGLLFWAAGRRPTAMAAGLCCARASLDRLVRAYRAGTWEELDLPRWPKGGAMGRPKGPQGTVMTPGQHAKPSLAGAREVPTGTRWHCRGARQTHGWYRDLLARLAARSPAPRDRRRYSVVENGTSHTATAVGPWLARQPRIQWWFLPPSGPRATPSERACGDGHDTCPRHHTRTPLEDLGGDVEQPCQTNGPWGSQLAHLYDAPEVTTAMAALAAEALCQAAA